MSGYLGDTTQSTCPVKATNHVQPVKNQSVCSLLKNVDLSKLQIKHWSNYIVPVGIGLMIGYLFWHKSKKNS